MKANITTILLVLARLTSAASLPTVRISASSDSKCAHVVNDHLFGIHEYLLANEQENNPLWNTTTINRRDKFLRGRRGSPSAAVKSARDYESEHPQWPEHSTVTALPVTADNPRGTFEIIVPTYVHFVTELGPDSVSYWSRKIQQIMDNLNAPFHPHGIHHALRGMDTTHAPFWAAGMAPYEMIRLLRKGTQGSLNFFVLDDWDMRTLELGSDSPSSSSHVLGATLATSLLEQPVDTDAVLLKTEAVDMTHIMAHEAGHWHGLLHTFEGESCDRNHDHGDYVRDTPRQRAATRTCPRDATSVDTCPDRPEEGAGDAADPSESGPDAVDNVMDYTPETCGLKIRFTGGQVLRMSNFWKLYREPYL